MRFTRFTRYDTCVINNEMYCTCISLKFIIKGFLTKIQIEETRLLEAPPKKSIQIKATFGGAYKYSSNWINLVV